MFAFLWIVPTLSGLCQEIDNCSLSQCMIQEQTGAYIALLCVAAEFCLMLFLSNKSLLKRDGNLLNRSMHYHTIVDLVKQVSYLSINKTNLYWDDVILFFI